MTVLGVRRLHPEAVLPARAHPGDAGLDLSSVVATEILPGGRADVPTGIAVAIPSGHVGLVSPRSGAARRFGVTLTNSPGVIDSGYRGEVVVLMVNHGDGVHRVAVGDRVAQLLVVPIASVLADWTDALPESDDRASGGFGSTGR
ncbi:MAG: dUTP diphosphatase [Actinobacteria bacterium]|nr:dUTP diphosphatase [Actinomycetota bacterium]